MQSTPKVISLAQYKEFVEEIKKKPVESQPKEVEKPKEVETKPPIPRLSVGVNSNVQVPKTNVHSQSLSLSNGRLINTNDFRSNIPKNSRTPIDEFKEGFDLAIIDLETENLKLKSPKIDDVIKELKNLKKKLNHQ